MAGIGVEVPSVGTFYTNAIGSYAGIVPYGYAGTAVPHYTAASYFIPSVRAYSGLVVDTPNQDYVWVAVTQAPWISGTVTPATTGIGVEFPAVGTFSVNATTGSYTGTVPYGYNGTALPHYWGADIFTPPVRVYANQLANAYNQDYAWTPIVHYRGTDAFAGRQASETFHRTIYSISLTRDRCRRRALAPISRPQFQARRAPMLERFRQPRSGLTSLPLVFRTQARTAAALFPHRFLARRRSSSWARMRELTLAR